MTSQTSHLDQRPQATRLPDERRRRRPRRPALLLGAAGVALLAVVAAILVGQYGARSDDSNRPAAFDAATFIGGPRLAVDQTTIDHGAVPFGHQVTAEYRLKNVGEQPLQIDKPVVKTLDGC